MQESGEQKRRVSKEVEIAGANAGVHGVLVCA